MRIPRRAVFLLAVMACSGVARAATPAPLQLDKSEQRRLHVLTRRPLIDALVQLPARVVADPRRRWRGSVDQPGFLEAPAGGFPLAGSKVAAGQVLAWLRPALSEPERRDLQTRRAIAQQDFDVASLQIHRFDIDIAQTNNVSLPTPAIQVVADYKDASARNGALDQGLNDRVALTAPADGVLLSSLAQTQRVAVAGEVLFEGVGDASYGVEVAYDDPSLDASAAKHAHTENGAEIDIEFLGQAFDPATRSQRALYAIASGPTLAVAQPVRVSFPRRQPQARLPRSSVFASGGRSWVWVHDTAEHFVPRVVTTGEIDAGWLEVRAGLGGSERVVLDAAALARDTVAVR